ncbi:MAG: transcription termination/antitermination protein NusA [Candidatus Pacebacteria bacterium]|nr:transcription termination/antitermination protein NusA [Candidatus Paceibacterota bacterium]
MFDLKVIHSVLDQLEEEKGIPREKIIEAIAMSLASAYKKEYGKRGQIIRANFDIETGKTEFSQIKIVVDETQVKLPSEEESTEDVKEINTTKNADSDKKEKDEGSNDEVNFNPEHHILLTDAVKIKADAKLEEEIIFPLETKGDFGRIAAQTAKQTIIQKIREAEKSSISKEFDSKQNEIISGTIQRIERGNIFVDLQRATGILSYSEQIPSEKFKQGERIRAYLYSVEETVKGVFLRLSRVHPQFLKKLFEIEVPEIASGVVEIKAIVREAGSRSKIAVISNDESIDPIGSLVGQRGVRVSTVMSELGGEKIDIIEWSEDPKQFITEALSPAKIIDIETNDEEKTALVQVSEDQLSLAIGKGGQNVRLAARLTGWKIDIQGLGGESKEKADDKEVEKIETPAKTETPVEEVKETPIEETKDDIEEEVETTETPVEAEASAEEPKKTPAKEIKEEVTE